MKRLKKEMDQIKVESYKDCVWYIKDEDKCKMPGIGVSLSECFCKDKEMMDEFCVWLTKFFKAGPDDDDDVELETMGCEFICGEHNTPTTPDFNERSKEDSYSDIVGRFVSDLKNKMLK